MAIKTKSIKSAALAAIAALALSLPVYAQNLGQRSSGSGSAASTGTSASGGVSAGSGTSYGLGISSSDGISISDGLSQAGAALENAHVGLAQAGQALSGVNSKLSDADAGLSNLSIDLSNLGDFSQFQALSNFDFSDFFSGLEGLQGLEGLNGLEGLSGLQGLEGLSRLQGLAGLQGLEGLSGLQSLEGLSNLQGLQGIDGVASVDDQETAPAAGKKAVVKNDDEQDADAQDEKSEKADKAQERVEREEELYNDGVDEIDDAKWEKASEKFDQVIEMHGKHADGAISWKAYAENKQGHHSEALTLLASLEKEYPSSKWVKEGKVMQIEIHQPGANTSLSEGQGDCELKLYAVNALQQADPEKAIPILQKMLHGSDCPKIASQALFVLAESGSPEAIKVIGDIAMGNSNPELQHKAIQDLGLFSGSRGRDTLLQIYTSSNDITIKKQVLNAFMLSGARSQLLSAAKSEKNPDLRAEAIKQMGLMGAKEDIWQLYQSEQDVQVKKHILQALWLSGDSERVGQLAINEKDHSLRLQAINDLGLMGRSSEPILKQIYASDPDLEVRRKVINAMFLAGDSRGLVDLARKETDPTLKKAIVSQLSLMGDKDAMDYLMEILNK
jgi:HEAT repeat protein